jgi:hypothetical protein
MPRDNLAISRLLGNNPPLERLTVSCKVRVVPSQRSDRAHAAAKQPVPMAMPMAGTRNQ